MCTAEGGSILGSKLIKGKVGAKVWVNLLSVLDDFLDGPRDVDDWPSRRSLDLPGDIPDAIAVNL